MPDNNAACRRYYARNPEKTYLRVKQWRIDNPEKARASKRLAQHIRRARLLGAKGRYTLAEWETLKSDFGNVCLHCLRTESVLKEAGLHLSPDHVQPLAKGGRNSIDNLQPLCNGKGGCNNRKHTRWVDYRLGFLLEIL